MTARIEPGDGDPRHGTDNGYRNLGCRCSECRAAAARTQRERLHRTGQRVPMAEYTQQRREAAEARDNHGTETRYSFGCRCGLCRRAVADARARRRRDEAA